MLHWFCQYSGHFWPLLTLINPCWYQPPHIFNQYQCKGTLFCLPNTWLVLLNPLMPFVSYLLHEFLRRLCHYDQYFPENVVQYAIYVFFKSGFIS